MAIRLLDGETVESEIEKWSQTLRAQESRVAQLLAGSPAWREEQVNLTYSCWVLAQLEEMTPAKATEPLREPCGCLPRAHICEDPPSFLD